MKRTSANRAKMAIGAIAVTGALSFGLAPSTGVAAIDSAVTIAAAEAGTSCGERSNSSTNWWGTKTTYSRVYAGRSGNYVKYKWYKTVQHKWDNHTVYPSYYRTTWCSYRT